MPSWGLSFAVASVCGGELRSRAWRTASPAGRARPRSWPWTACTCGTGPVEARRRSVSRATGGTSLATVLGPRGGCCGGTSCTGGHLRHPSLWCRCQNLLEARKVECRITLNFILTLWDLCFICKHYAAINVVRAAFTASSRNVDYESWLETTVCDHNQFLSSLPDLLFHEEAVGTDVMCR